MGIILIYYMIMLPGRGCWACSCIRWSCG